MGREGVDKGRIRGCDRLWTNHAQAYMDELHNNAAFACGRQ